MLKFYTMLCIVVISTQAGDGVAPVRGHTHTCFQCHRSNGASLRVTTGACFAGFAHAQNMLLGEVTIPFSVGMAGVLLAS